MEGGGVGNVVSPLVDFIAGTVGGVASLLAGHPFDTIKTRLQAQSQAPSTSSIPDQHAHVSSSTSSSPLLSRSITTRYTSSLDALRRIIAEERFVGLYKGVTSPMLGVALMNASVFGVYGLVLRNLQHDSEQARLRDIFLAGCASGVVSALITSPIDLIKIRQQLFADVKVKQPSTMYVIKSVWNQGGLRGIYRGLGCTCIRDLGYGPYFLSYEVFNRWALSLKHGEKAKLTNFDLAMSGGAAGLLAWLSTFGADVVKTRVQATNRRPGEGNAFLTAAKATFREGGWRAFLAGVGPTMLRALPVNAVLFITFEATKDFLSQKRY
ncbi:hypothetical protein CBS101457_002503 [Exobasidium rhododendri]|nr:hypothetical protein CBS101457_002503 [Exobasidium rhododendri]